MRQLRFHKGLYSASALDVATSAFAEFAQIERRDDPDHLVVALSAHDDADEVDLAGEFANYVLGATVDATGGEGSAS